MVALPTWVVVIPIKSLLFLTAYTNCPSVSRKGLLKLRKLETFNAAPEPLLYFSFCPVKNPWLGIEIESSPINPERTSWSGRTVPSLATTLVTCVLTPTTRGLSTVTWIVPIPIVDCGLNTTSLFFLILKLVFIPMGNVNLFWSTYTISPSEKYVLIPLSLKIL